jgi:hypothetical protein
MRRDKGFSLSQQLCSAKSINPSSASPHCPALIQFAKTDSSKS